MKRGALVLVFVAACSRSREAGLEVTIDLGAGLHSQCVQLAAKRPGGAELRSTPVPVMGKQRLIVGVPQGTLPDDVTLYAEGFADAQCATVSDPPERSPDVAAHFERGAIREVTLALPASGPNRETNCADGLDSDQDGVADCLDSDCDGLPCPGGGMCGAGACRGTTSEKALCADGADNDGDGQSDCDDGDCLNEACRSSDRCLVDARCTAAKACAGGSAKVCDAPVGACAGGSGTCDPASGQCVFPPADAGSACDDHDACTSADRCDGQGSCVGGAMVGCTNPPSCFTSTGAVCDPLKGCLYPAAPATACDDGQSCTTGDRCGSDGGCAGVAAACAPGDCQTFTGACGADGGCVFGSRAAGTACDAGVCNAGGGCIPHFPYPPANFSEAQVPTPPAGDVTLGCGVSAIDTGVSGSPTFTNWCGQPLPGFATIAQPGGPDAVLLSFTRLTVMAGATLQVKGARPAIIVAMSDVALAGLVDVSAGASGCADAGAGAVGDEGVTNGGGGGGAFATPGGAGGKGSTPVFGSAGNGGAAGGVNGSPALVPLRGGCPGGLGARSGVPRDAAGGGALQVSSAGTISVSGTITAPGQGGPGAGNGTGGNGAGSGGAIALEALQLTISAPAVLTAHGGGGGEGGGPLIDGDPGSPGTADAGAAQGGSNNGQTGGPGGNGATQTQAATNGEDGTLGTGNGGGGGGGLGRIRLRASVGCSVGVGVLVSPAAPADAGCP